MQCDQFRQLVDSYLHNELAVETNHQVILHMEHCADCRQELSVRRKLRLRLRQAYTNAPDHRLRPEFARRLREQLLDQAKEQRVNSIGPQPLLHSLSNERRTSLLALAACLVLATGIGLVFFQQPLVHPENTGISQLIPPVNNSSGISLVREELVRSAVGDHRDCAIRFRLAEKPINLEMAGRQYDPVYVNLTKSLSLPLDVELVEEHSCVFEARRFAHIVLKYQGRLVSFLVTESALDSTPQGSSDSQVISCSQLDGYQVSYFQTRRHTVFVVSDMQEGENLQMTRALAPTVYAHITRAENAA